MFESGNTTQHLTTHLKTSIARQIPVILGKSFVVMPFFLQKRLLTLVLQRIFQDALVSGDMDFLQDLHIRFEIEDSELQWTFTYAGQSLEMVNNNHADVIIRCRMLEFVLLANRQVDPDTLFFQRRLVIEGNTELALTLKNLMDTLDPESLPLPLFKGLQMLEYLLDPKP